MMRKYWLTILLGILFALLSNMIVYNYKVIVFYALKFNQQQPIFIFLKPLYFFFNTFVAYYECNG
ncbi:MAG: hypothetical protein WAZ36_02910 [Sediminibacterium sp.]